MKKTPSRKDWWEPYSGLFIDVTGWLVVPILLGLFLGGFLDEKFTGKPLFTLILVAVGFIISVSGIIREVNSLAKDQRLREDKRKMENRGS